MNVRELIEKLQAMPPDAEVMYDDCDEYGCMNIEYVKQVEKFWRPTYAGGNIYQEGVVLKRYSE